MAFCPSKLSRDRLQGVQPDLAWWSSAGPPALQDNLFRFHMFRSPEAPDHAVLRLRPENSIPLRTRCSAPRRWGHTDPFESTESQMVLFQIVLFGPGVASEAMPAERHGNRPGCDANVDAGRESKRLKAI